jgi:hypothetical protein
MYSLALAKVFFLLVVRITGVFASFAVFLSTKEEAV